MTGASLEKRIRMGDNPEFHLLLERWGRIDPERIEDYIAMGGYNGLRRVVKTMSPQEVIAEVEQSTLRGRGGGGFPTAAKWRQATGVDADTRYVIGNAYGADTGSQVDRWLMEGDAHVFLEGMIIAAYAVGADLGYIFCHQEDRLAARRAHLAVQQAEERGFLGQSIMDSDFSFTVRVVSASVGFIGGEETALIATLEGRRAMPDQKPPYPAEKGLWGKPTVVHSLETLANLPWIITHGAEAYAAIGPEGAHGTKLITLGGQVFRPGVAEVLMGTPLRSIIDDLGGGMSNGRAFKTVQVGGPSGGCLPTSLLDTPLGFDSLSSVGAAMGSGTLWVIDDGTCMVDYVRERLSYLAQESCGECVPCRLGLKRMVGLLEGISSNRGHPADMDTLQDLADHIGSSSLCGLGLLAPQVFVTVQKHFPQDFQTHLEENRCPTGHCQPSRNRRYERKDTLWPKR
ncbi:MAG: SLBB domain-containing protein [Chloroflexi bacterium]|nr:SLBB domain-containing protein [Chloroflexota bacterium]